MPMNPVLTGLIATAVALLIIVFVVVVALYRRHRRGRSIPKQEPVDENPPIIPLNATTAVDHLSDETDPDVIPNKHGKYCVLISARTTHGLIIFRASSQCQRYNLSCGFKHLLIYL